MTRRGPTVQRGPVTELDVEGAPAVATALPVAHAQALDAFARHLRAERGLSPHTVRAYVGDVASLLDHAWDRCFYSHTSAVTTGRDSGAGWSTSE